MDRTQRIWIEREWIRREEVFGFMERKGRNSEG